MAIKHNGVVYARHQTLGMNVRDPSPAMVAWIESDARWHEDSDYITMSGGSLPCAAQHADHEAKERVL